MKPATYCVCILYPVEKSLYSIIWKTFKSIFIKQNQSQINQHRNNYQHQSIHYHLFEIDGSFRFIDIEQPGNYGKNYGAISGSGSSKTWAHQNYGAIRFRSLRSYADNAAAVADNFPQDGLYMADGTGTIEKGTLMRRY